MKILKGSRKRVHDQYNCNAQLYKIWLNLKPDNIMVIFYITVLWLLEHWKFVICGF